LSGQPVALGTVETFWRASDPAAGERIVVDHVSEREVRFGYARGAAPVKWGRHLTWEAGHTHTGERAIGAARRDVKVARCWPHR
jgi:hypothetical protein